MLSSHAADPLSALDADFAAAEYVSHGMKATPATPVGGSPSRLADRPVLEEIGAKL
jgi:hypothetical protein